MIEGPVDRWEQQLAETARAFVYPPTPNLARTVARQIIEPRLQAHRPRWVPRLAWAAAFILVLFTLLMSVPSVRAQVLEFLQVGIVRIFLAEPTASPTVVPPAGMGRSAEPGSTPSPSPTARLALVPNSSLLRLDGETNLEDASSQTIFPIQLPQYPEDLGEPDKVYLQDLEGQVLVLVWLTHDQSGDVQMSLHMYGSENLTAEKLQPRAVQTTEVHSEPAVWAVGPYFLKVRNGNYQEIRLIDGHVLIWESKGTTYRLETDLPIEEAVRVAESLQPYAPPGP